VFEQHLVFLPLFKSIIMPLKHEVE